jgi:hypothetical protein
MGVTELDGHVGVPDDDPLGDALRDPPFLLVTS